MRQELHPGAGIVLRVEQRLERRIAAARLQAGGDADAGEPALAPDAVAPSHQRRPVSAFEHFVDHHMVVAAVIGAAAGDQIGEFLAADEVAATHLDAVEPEMLGDALDGGLDGVVGGRLAEAAHRLLGRLVGGHRDGTVGDAGDAVGADDGADRLAQLERRAARIGADIVERAHAHRAHDAGLVERHLDVEAAVRPLGVARGHVLQAILHEPHRCAQPPRQETGEHRVLDAALDPVAAADVDVVMHPDCIAGQAQGAGDLVGKFRHLDRGPDVEQFEPGIPLGHHAERLDRHRGAAPPAHPEGERMRALGKIAVDLAPDELPVEDDVRSVIGVHRRAVGPKGLLGIEHVRQRLVAHGDQLARILGKRAAFRHHGGDPLAAVARPIDRERITPDLRGIDPGQQRVGRGGKRAPGQHVADAGHGQRLGGVDLADRGCGMRRAEHRHVQHVGPHHVGGVAPAAHYEPPVLAHPALGRHEAERVLLRTGHGRFPSGALAARSRSAASRIASTIWP